MPPTTSAATATRTAVPAPDAGISPGGASGGGAVIGARRVFVDVSRVSFRHSGHTNRSPRCDDGTAEIAPHHGQSNVRSPDRCGASGGATVAPPAFVFFSVSFVDFLHSGHAKCSPRWSAGTGVIAPHHGQSNVLFDVVAGEGFAVLTDTSFGSAAALLPHAPKDTPGPGASAR